MARLTGELVISVKHLSYNSICSIVTSFLPRLNRTFQANSLGWVVLHTGCNSLLPVPHTPSCRNTSGANFFPLWVTAYALFCSYFSYHTSIGNF